MAVKKVQKPLKSVIKRWAKDTLGEPCKEYDQYCYTCISWDGVNRFIAVMEASADDKV